MPSVVTTNPSASAPELTPHSVLWEEMEEAIIVLFCVLDDAYADLQVNSKRQKRCICRYFVVRSAGLEPAAF